MRCMQKSTNFIYATASHAIIIVLFSMLNCMWEGRVGKLPAVNAGVENNLYLSPACPNESEPLDIGFFDSLSSNGAHDLAVVKIDKAF